MVGKQGRKETYYLLLFIPYSGLVQLLSLGIQKTQAAWQKV